MGGAVAASDVQRKLTVILVADVVGYSRLMGENEPATVRTLTGYRQIFSDYVEKFRGRIVNAPGDSILAEFASVVDAVEGASEIQRELAERNAELLEERRMQFRIGINLGDVLVKDDAIYGDGVNIAARLESLAEPGGICVSRHVYDHVRQKLKLNFEYMGEQQAKNIAEPVRAYQVLTRPGDAAHRLVRAKKLTSGPVRLFALVAVALLVIGGGGFWGWHQIEQQKIQAAVAAFKLETDFPLPEKPSIAVLAFDNLSGDKEQDFFADGLAENIIAGLSMHPGLFVVRPQFLLHLHRQAGGCAQGGARTGRTLCAGGKRPENGAAHPRHGPAFGRSHRTASLGRPVQPGIERPVRPSG